MIKKSTPSHMLIRSLWVFVEAFFVVRWFRHNAAWSVIPFTFLAATPVYEAVRTRLGCFVSEKNFWTASITRDLPVPPGPVRSIRRGSAFDVCWLCSVIIRKALSCSSFRENVLEISLIRYDVSKCICELGCPRGNLMLIDA